MTVLMLAASVACTPNTQSATTVAGPPPADPTPTTVTTSTTPGLLPCPKVDVLVDDPPGTVSEAMSVPTDFGDTFTSIPGTSQAVFSNDDATPAMVIVRGSLPPEGWTGATERVDVRGVTGAVGPLSAGMWAIAWAESPDRCDLYSVFIYPPGTVDDARQVARSIR